MLIKIDNGQDQNCVFAGVLHQLKGVPADYHLKHLWCQLTKSLIVMRDPLKVSLFFLLYLFSYHKHYFTKTFTVSALYLPKLFHINFYSVCSVLTKHYFTKTFTVCTLYLPNIISQKLLQCGLCTYQTLFHKKHYIK